MIRNVSVQFPSGREVLNSYWGFLRHGGLVLRSASDLKEGDALLLDVKIHSLKRSYQLPARVVKAPADGHRAFVAFDESEGQDLMLYAAWADSHEVPQRKHRRYPIVNDVRYTHKVDPTHAMRGRLLDVSPGGCRLKGVHALEAGALIKVISAGVELDGQIRWRTPGAEMGVEFARPDLVIQTLLDPQV